jgi:Terminase large subunit, T4likevirus-type, N-terminal
MLPICAVRRGRKDAAMVAEPKVRVVWSPRGNPAQMRLLQCPVFEIFFGGARGGGKTDGVLGEFGAHASRYGKDAIGLMVRRTRAELVETIERSREIYGPLGWTLNETEKMWRAPDGARLRFAYLERDADADMYQGHNYTRVYVEEVGNFPSPAPVMKLMATLRSGAGVPVGLRATGNPGGPGHQWVRQRYIDPAPLDNRIICDPVTGLERVFIPSKVDNNQYIDVEAYKQRLRASGSQELVRHGSTVTGASPSARFSTAGKASGMWWRRLIFPRTGCAFGRVTGVRLAVLGWLVGHRAR